LAHTILNEPIKGFPVTSARARIEVYFFSRTGRKCLWGTLFSFAEICEVNPVTDEVLKGGKRGFDDVAWASIFG
jgi:hypothetical protein